MSTRQILSSTALGLVSLMLASAAPAQQAADPTKNLTPVTDAMLHDPPAADWLMWRRTYDGYGFSPLDQITKDNVKDLKRSTLRPATSSGNTSVTCRRR